MPQFEIVQPFVLAQWPLPWPDVVDSQVPIPALYFHLMSLRERAWPSYYARQHQLRLAVRGGGHTIAASATCDDGLVIDLSRMKPAQVDPERRRAWTYFDMDQSPDAVNSLVNNYLARDYSNPPVESEINGVRFDS
jgi:hypothetical protein